MSVVHDMPNRRSAVAPGYKSAGTGASGYSCADNAAPTTPGLSLRSITPPYNEITQQRWCVIPTDPRRALTEHLLIDEHDICDGESLLFIEIQVLRPMRPSRPPPRHAISVSGRHARHALATLTNQGYSKLNDPCCPGAVRDVC
jgi:hypothetical protein